MIAWEFVDPRGAHRLQRAAAVRRSKPERGFSLLELMVVVTIIGVLSALVLPSMTQAMRERHAQEAAVEIVDLLRELRSRSMYRGRAQTVLLRQVGTTLRVEAYEGTASSCRLSRFRLSAGTGFVAAEQIASMDFSEARYARDDLATVISLPVGTTFLQICYTPMGNTFFTTTETSIESTAWSNDNGAVGTGGAFQVDVFQLRDGTQLGVRRRVMIPLGGNPRLRTS